MSPQDTVQSKEVYTLPSDTLHQLPLPMPGAMQRRDLRRVLGCAAASRRAIPPACHPRARAPSGATVLGTRAQQRGDLEALAGHGHALLARRWPNSWGHRGRGVASALLRVPEHGPVEAAQHDESLPSHSQEGHATLFPLCHGLCRAPRPPRSPGALACAGHADHGSCGASPPGAFGPRGAPPAAPVARPRFFSGAGDARPDSGGVALPQARGQPRHKAHAPGGFLQ